MNRKTAALPLRVSAAAINQRERRTHAQHRTTRSHPTTQPRSRGTTIARGAQRNAHDARGYAPFHVLLTAGAATARALLDAGAAPRVVTQLAQCRNMGAKTLVAYNHGWAHAHPPGSRERDTEFATSEALDRLLEERGVEATLDDTHWWMKGGGKTPRTLPHGRAPVEGCGAVGVGLRWAMPVSDRHAVPLFRAFGLLEYQLKRRPAFLKAGRFDNAMVDWAEVKALVDGLPDAYFVLQLKAFTRQKMLNGARDRPKVQIVIEVGGQRHATFAPRPLRLPNEVPSDARALVEAAKRVRNNLFHGGKEDDGEQPFDGDDDEWARAALDITQRLLALVDQGAFGPPVP